MKTKILKRTIVLLIFLILLLNIYPFILSNASTDDNLKVYAPSAILMDEDSGKILYEKNAYEKMYPASTTKLLTAILAVENCNLDEIAKVSYNAVISVPSSYSNAALQVDEELSVNDLLHALLIPSANDAANVLAEHIAGSVQSFSTMMNTKASEIGCKNSHFVNPSGIHDENHYSTAYDLCLIGKYASKYDVIRKISSTTSYTLPMTNKYSKDDRILKATNYLLRKDYPKYYYEYANGLKTGYTTEAKDCIIASASQDDKNLVCVVLGANSTINGEKFLDCKELFNYGFNKYIKKTLVNKGDVIKKTKISGATLDTKLLDIRAEDSISVLLNKSDLYLEPNSTISLKPGLCAPINEGDIVRNYYI